MTEGALDRDEHFGRLADQSPVGHDFPWVAAQRWEQVLFVNWRVPESLIRPLVPSQLELDRYHDETWLSLLPLRMAHVHLHGLPPLPELTDFPELNLRTYVRRGGVPGVWFLSLDAPGHLACWLGRHVFHLPYDHARMEMGTEDGFTRFTSRRQGAKAAFGARYRGTGDALPMAPGSVEEFLCERYAMYAVNHEGHLLRGDIHHAPWLLRPPECSFDEPAVISGFGLPPLGAPDLICYSDATENVVWPLVRA